MRVNNSSNDLALAKVKQEIAQQSSKGSSETSKLIDKAKQAWDKIPLDEATKVSLSNTAKALLQSDLPLEITSKLLDPKALKVASTVFDLGKFGINMLSGGGTARPVEKTEHNISESIGDKQEKKQIERQAKVEALKQKEILKKQEIEKKQKELEAKQNLREMELHKKRQDHIMLQRSQKIKNDKMKGTLNTPGIFFIKGTQLLGISTDYGGIRKMAENIPGARLYASDQVDDILWEVEKRDSRAPIILVGHSSGGDSAVEIANRLNSLDYGFRKVNLLVTLDSFGMDNDIIPQNVSKNLNYFGENSWPLNDGPNVAREVEKTVVINELRPEDHDQLDDAKDIQFDILNAIRDTI